MHRLVSHAILLTALVVPGTAPSEVQSASLDGGVELTIRAAGLTTGQGNVAFALFDSERSYDDRTEPVRRAFIPARDGACEWVVEGLPPGKYAAMAYHDRNGNGQLDRRKRLGIPKEPYGFSNNAQALFGPPKFEKARFDVSERQTRIEIRLR
jgi:uncharacterized protein (DUF2141 family)